MTTTQNIDELIAYLVDRKFKKWGGGPFPSLESWRQSREGNLKRHFSLSQDEAEYQAELKKLSHSELQALLAETQNQEANEERKCQETEDKTRFFYEPRAQADFVHWSKMARWTLDDATALALGKAPEIVNWERIKLYIPGSPFAKKYQQIRAILLRANEAGEVESNPRPRDFLAWTEQKSIDFPEDLKKQVYAVDQKTETWEALRAQRDELKSRLAKCEAARTSETPLGTRERNTLLKIIIAMAIDKYRYNKDAPHQRAAGSIAESTAKVGVPVSDDTIRKYLAEAAVEYL
jgi:hypothetical protein